MLGGVSVQVGENGALVDGLSEEGDVAGEGAGAGGFELFPDFGEGFYQTSADGGLSGDRFLQGSVGGDLFLQGVAGERTGGNGEHQFVAVG